MAKIKWLYFGLSVLTLLIGLTLVLVFIGYLVAPSLSRHASVWRHCIVLNITLIKDEQRSHVDVQLLQQQANTSDRITDNTYSDLTGKEYTSDKGRFMLEPGRQQWVNEDKTRRRSNGSLRDNSTCFMVYVRYGVRPSDVSLPRIVQKTQNGILLPNPGRHPRLIGAAPGSERGASQLCFCRRCQKRVSSSTNHSVLLYDKGTISQGDTIKCTLRLPTSDVLDKDNVTTEQVSVNSYYLINAMLWPTIVFIAGFVGLFFTSILLMKHN